MRLVWRENPWALSAERWAPEFASGSHLLNFTTFFTVLQTLRYYLVSTNQMRSMRSMRYSNANCVQLLQHVYNYVSKSERLIIDESWWSEMFLMSLISNSLANSRPRYIVCRMSYCSNCTCSVRCADSKFVQCVPIIRDLSFDISQISIPPPFVLTLLASRPRHIVCCMSYCCTVM